MHANLIKAFAPTGVLRASLNMGNPVLANMDTQGKPFGISISPLRFAFLPSPNRFLGSHDKRVVVVSHNLAMENIPSGQQTIAEYPCERRYR